MKLETFEKIKPKIGKWVKFVYLYNGRKFEDEGRLTDASYGKVVIKSENFHGDIWIINIKNLLFIK